MASLKKSVEDFLQKQLRVYQADCDRLIQDANTATRTAMDHVGRWHLELLQNSDDAKAVEVLMRFASEAVYIADDGQGFVSSAVGTISRTDLSDKKTGTIGRKGVGFKSVYTVSENPQIFSLDGEGLEFSLPRAEKWLMKNNINNFQKKIPYQCLPFFISRNEAERIDPILSELSGFSTVIKLPFKNAPQLDLVKFYSFGLLLFNHLKKLEIQYENDSDRSFTLKVSRGNSNIWTVTDSRQESPVKWRVFSPSPIAPPDEVLSQLNEDERERIENDFIGFIVAATLDERGLVCPTEEYYPVHVFYPADNDLAPVRLLLHAEFIVKSDRTALVSIQTDQFNNWVADQLAIYIIDFVQSVYDEREPTAYLRLLKPFEDRGSHEVARVLWDKITPQARDHLKLPDSSGELRLSCNEALLIGVTVEVTKARQILARSRGGSFLLHSAFDNKDEAREVLKKLDCQMAEDEDILEVIREFVPLMADDYEFIWICWCWLAKWVEVPNGDEFKERLSYVKELPIVPINDDLVPKNALHGSVTWRSENIYWKVPEWLPLHFLNDWFRDRILDLSEDDPVQNLINEFKIKEPGINVFENALGDAIKKYWENPTEDPKRFLKYIREINWLEQERETPKEWGRCPVPARIEGQDSTEWVEARHTYFGRGWGNECLARLYEKIEGIAWAQYSNIWNRKDDEKDILDRLGVFHYPRVVEWDCNDEIKQNEMRRITKSLPSNVYPEEPLKFYILEQLEKLDNLNVEKTADLLMILAVNWNDYYSNKQEEEVNCEGSRGGWKPRQRVTSFWWEQLKNKLKPPLANSRDNSVPLGKCWLPDKNTFKAIGDLLPVIDLKNVGAENEIVQEWLKKQVGVRTSIDSLTLEEWKELLETRIPHVITSDQASDEEKYSNKVVSWYETFLDSINDDDIKENCFSNTPLLCRKGDQWDYVGGDVPRWLSDVDYIEKAFREEVWFFYLPSRLRKRGKKVFGVDATSNGIEERPIFDNPLIPQNEEISRCLEEIRPYLYVLRRSQTKESKEKLKNHIKKLVMVVVDHLEVNLNLSGMTKTIQKNFMALGERLILDKCVCESADHAMPYLAQALAESLEVKRDADFYENLLRCKSENVIKSKILTKDAIDELNLGRYLNEYHSSEEEELTASETERSVENTENLTSDRVQEASQAARTSDTSSRRPDNFVEIEGTSPPSGTVRTTSSPELCLKDPETAPYKVDDTIDTQGAFYGGGEGGGIGGEIGSGAQHTLTQEERDSIEDCGRKVVERELRNKGYEVEQMPRNNPGYDIKATQQNETILIEVKAHLLRASQIILTIRELKEYHRRLTTEEGDVKWQLWNVQNLAVSGPTIQIAYYENIPEEAIRSKDFIVDLNKCT